jgi:hypothetical protein
VSDDDERAGWLALFGQTERDLEENRRGRLSPRQRHLASSATRDDAIFMVGLAVVLSAVMIGVLWMLVSNGRVLVWDDGVSFAEIVIVAFTVGLPLVSLGWAGWTVHIHLASRGEARVEVREGALDKRVLRHGRAEVCSITIAGESLDVAPLVFDRLMAGARYRVFFVPGSRVVVMVEPLGD